MSRQDASTRKIQAADLASKRKPASGLGDELRVHVLLHMQQARVVSLPEEVDVSMVNGRGPREWEEGEIRSARLRERRSELALFDGLMS